MGNVVKEVKKLMAGAMAPSLDVFKTEVMDARTTEKEHAMDTLASLEDKLFDQALSVVGDAISFGDLPLDSEELPQDLCEEFGAEEAERIFRGVPQAWIDKHGEAAAERKFRNTKAGQMKSSEAPAGMKVAEKILTGIMKTRALRGAAPVLNLSLVQLTVEPAREYPTQSRDS